jgi:hypothetical protein
MANMDLGIARERMKRRLQAQRGKTGYIYREPGNINAKPSEADKRHERVQSNIRGERFVGGK